MASRLTAVAVKNFKAGRHGDGGGLYLEVKPTGRAYWIYRGSYRDPGCWPTYLTRAAMRAPRRALPRRRALCTNSKLRYCGSFSGEMPRCGRSQDPALGQQHRVLDLRLVVRLARPGGQNGRQNGGAVMLGQVQIGNGSARRGSASTAPVGAGHRRFQVVADHELRHPAEGREQADMGALASQLASPWLAWASAKIRLEAPIVATNSRISRRDEQRRWVFLIGLLRQSTLIRV